MKKENKIIGIQNLLIKQMNRLDKSTGKNINVEIHRSGALSQNAQAYLKAVGTQLRVKEFAIKTNTSENDLMKETGL